MQEIFEFFNERDMYNQSAVKEMQNCLKGEKVVVIRNVWDTSFIDELIAYLSSVGRSSIPNYHPIKPKSPNFNRLNKVDKRAFVKGCFEQFNFFPWNQDYFNLFEKSRKIFEIKNELSGIPRQAFHEIGDPSLENFTARIAFQFYPAGQGFLNKHSDPIGEHQFALPNMILSQKGNDFVSGGTYFELNGHRIYHEDYCNKGDIIMFNASLPHGVDLIDEDKSDVHWLDYRGRWMALFSVNKYAGNDTVSNSIDLK